MKHFLHKLRSDKELLVTILTGIFLLIGVGFRLAGFSIVQLLTPLVLGIIAALVILFWPVDPKRRLIVSIVAIVMGITAEAIGVHTAILFGSYTYGDSIGIRLFDVPVIIGIVWLMVTVAAWQMVFVLQFGRVASVILASGLVVVFDLLLEQFATLFGLWSWQDGIIPLKNYISWAVVSAIIFTLYALYAPQKRASLYGVTILPMLAIFFWLMLL